MKTPFQPTGEEQDEVTPPIPPQARRPLPKHEQRLMFEARTHWGRGLAILVGMAGIVIIFLVILTVLPKPGGSNPLDSLNSLTNAVSTSSTPAVLTGAVSSSTVAATVVRATPAPSGNGTATPTPKFVAVAAKNSPYVRNAANTNNNPIGNLAPGRQVEVVGKSPDNAWLQIVWDNNVRAWVAQDLMTIVTGDPAQIPIVR